MKESKFNVFYEAKSNSQKILAYNSRSNALATINLVQRIINNCYIKPMPLPLH